MKIFHKFASKNNEEVLRPRGTDSFVIKDSHPLSVYSKSFELGLRPGSFERNPKIKSDTKKLTTVYTRIFNVSIISLFQINGNLQKLAKQKQEVRKELE